MVQGNYLDGYVYHMVHFDNLHNIFLRRALLSKQKILQEQISYRSIAFEDVQGLRDRVFIWSYIEQKFRRLHSYVPFYFATHTPMLYVQYRRDVQEQIVIFEVNRSIVSEQGILFTDGNASNQQLAKHKAEVVDIMPATVLQGPCRRRYRPRGPLGTNLNVSHVYSDISFLTSLNWNVINNRRYSNDEEKRIKHAEVLVPDMVPLGKILGMSVSTQTMMNRVNTLIIEDGLEGRIPFATFKPDLFFP